MSERDSFLHLARPLGPAPVGAQPSTAPLNVAIQPQVRAYTVADIGLQALT
jgi:translation initiation factor 3 subunit F